ncbi:MAG TPA: hypothetical protein VKT77_12215 [Chthonomonadaceae bacterium]|nr:hypothetical protein [Chthonomonadaceae bacterium]
MTNLKPRGSAQDFWNTIKGISVNDIIREASRPISLALVGEAEKRGDALAALFNPETVGEPHGRALPEPAFVQEFDSTHADDSFPRKPNVFDVVIDVGGGRNDPPERTRIYSLVELGGWEPALDRILEDRPEIALALARNFPAFRRRVAENVIATTATANAQFALVTGITSAFPVLGVLLPVNGLSDTLMLTKNQIMMTLRLAAAYGLDISFKARGKELAPLLINALGWRAIARELVGAVPVVGFIARAGIAYAGTVTVGKSAMVYYETGEKIDKAQLQRWYREALESSKEKVRQLASAVKRRDKNQKALPPAEVNDDTVDAEMRDLPAAVR